jgi:cytochrome P450
VRFPAFDLTSPEFFNNPFPTWDRMRQDTPVYYSAELDTWFLTRHDDVQRMTTDRRFNSDRITLMVRGASEDSAIKVQELQQFFYSWLTHAEGADHLRKRRIWNRAFTPRAVAPLHDRVRASFEQHLAAVANKPEFDLKTEVTFPVAGDVIAALLGIPPIDVESLRHWIHDTMSAMSNLSADRDAILSVAHRGMTALLGYSRQLIELRRRSPGGDMLSKLIDIQATDDSITDDYIAAACSEILVGGHETTSSALASAVYELLNNPDQLNMLRQGNSTDSAVEELLRIHTAAMAIARFPLEDVEIGGQTILAGSTVLGVLPAANRDPAVFQCPNDVKIDRNASRHIAFGSGAHFCIGAPLARLQMRIGLPMIIALPGLRMSTRRVEWEPVYTFHSPKSVWVRHSGSEAVSDSA